MCSKLFDECNSYIAYVDHIQTRLEQLLDDLQNVQSLDNRLPYYFAVDFAELMALAFPLSSSHHIQMMPEESESNAFSREIAVLSFILSHRSEQIMSATRNLLMLPPFIDEMRAELTLVKNNLIKVNNLSNLLQGIDRMLFAPRGYKERRIGQIAEQFSQSGKIADADWRQLANHLKESYSDYLALVVSSAYGGASFLRQLVDQKVIRGWQSYFGQPYRGARLMKMGLDSVFSGNVAANRLDEYIHRLLTVASRRAEVKHIPNVTDAAACVMLRDLNDTLWACGEERRVILISHSRAMSHAVDPVRVKVGTEYRSIPGVRDLDYFWLYYVHMYLYSKEDGVRKMVSAIDEMNRTMLRFKEVYEGICRNKSVSTADIEEATEELRNVKMCMRHLSNASLAAQTDSTLLSFLYSMSAGSIPMRGYHEKREWAKQLLNVLTDVESAKVLSSKTAEISEQIQAIVDLHKRIDRVR